jgi:hypothetical protein
LWVPVTVAAALGGGVFVGAQLPSDSDKTVSSGSQPGGEVSGLGTSNAPSGASTGGTPTSAQSPQAVGSPAKVGSVGFTLADGWQVTPTSTTSACVTLKTSPKPTPAGSGSAAALPCGVDGLYLKTDAVPTAWPLSTATKDTGWWPAASSASDASDIVCPVAKPGSSDQVKDSVLLRSTAKYALADQTGQASPLTADYHEWAVVCDSGLGVRPMLWKLNAAPGAATPAKFTVATVVSADPQYDSALLGMVGSLHPSS